jgi:cyclophilin family peptidyl-prolyl cis-trans isomerase
MIPSAHRQSESSAVVRSWYAALAGSRSVFGGWRVALALTAVLLLAACSTAGGATPPGTAGPSVDEGACPTSQPDPLPAGETRTVTIDTDNGAIAVQIEADLSPIAAGNFVALAGCGYYDGVVFHRVVPGFVIQGGDPTGTGTGGPGYEIQDETVTATYSRGTVAMARTTQPNSVGSQFFIVLDDAARSALASANTYQIIGTVSSGMDAVDAIAAAADAELPSDPVVMTRVTVSNP